MCIRDRGKTLDKVTIKSIDKGGFVVNRLVDPFINEAVFMLEEGVGTAEDIDNGCKFGLNHPCLLYTSRCV